ncbi:glycosyltransferase family 4 protein, partial [Candidatus Gottesmanbacteria bacterium]|nr:glycosyltransferase family 4 protein [Candidatus Gottesmanbacteria bacterium]
FWEKKFWQTASRVVAMSAADKKIMQTLTPRLTVDLVPNGVDTEFFTRKKIESVKKGKVILFVGNFKWLQNREAVTVLVKQIWPNIKKKLPNIKLWIVGRFPTYDIQRFSSPSVKISSDIEDIRDAYRLSDVLIAPIYGPGGTRYKILEAMAAGLPVVTTPTGIEGLGVEHGREALVGINPSDLAKFTIQLLTDVSLYTKLATNGRKLVEKKFNWQTIADSLDHIYQKAIYASQN